MIPNWNKILKEWSYRVGVIKPNDDKHLYHLSKILEERGWPYEVITEFVNEIDFKDQDAFDAYNKKHKMRKSTKVTIGDKETTVGDAGGGTDDKQKDDKPKLKTSKEIKQNRQNIFDNTVTGKGGGTTALQEEIAGISREIANQHPDDTPEQHQERVSKFIKDNYGDTKFGSNEKMINGLVKKSTSGYKQ